MSQASLLIKFLVSHILCFQIVASLSDEKQQFAVDAAGGVETALSNAKVVRREVLSKSDSPLKAKTPTAQKLTNEEEKDEEDREPNCEHIGDAQFEQDFREAMMDAAEETDDSTEWVFHQGRCQYKYESEHRRRRRVKRTYEIPPKSEQQKVPCEEVAKFCAEACEKEETCMAYEVTLQRGLPDYSWCKIHGTEDHDLPMKSLPVGYDMDWHPVTSRRRQRSYPVRKPDNVYTGDAATTTYCMARASRPPAGRRRGKFPKPQPNVICRPSIDKFLLCDSVVQRDANGRKLRSVLYKKAGNVHGKSVDLLVSVSADTVYQGKPDQCGRNGCVGILNVQANNAVGFDFKLLEAGTEIAVVADELYFSVLDLDCGAQKGSDAPEVCGATEYAAFESNMEVESKGSEIVTKPWHGGGTQYEASVVGYGSDNPSNTTTLDEVAKGRVIRGKYTGVANWHVTFGVIGGNGYRNFLFDVSTKKC